VREAVFVVGVHVAALPYAATKIQEDTMAKGNNARKKETKKPKKDKK
jgi:hypothetical protein